MVAGRKVNARREASVLIKAKRHAESGRHEKAHITVKLSDGSIEEIAGANALTLQLLITSGRYISVDDFRLEFNLRARIHDLRGRFHLRIDTRRVLGAFGGARAEYKLLDVVTVIKSVGGFKK